MIDIAYNLSKMFNSFSRIIFIALFIITINPARPVFAVSVGTIEENKSSWYAVIKTENKGKKLCVKGDIFYSDENPAKGLRILDIRQDAITLEDVTSKKEIVLKPGEDIPVDGSGLAFEKTIEASVLDYNYNKNAKNKKFMKNQVEDFTIKSMEKQKVMLEKDYNKVSHAKQLSDSEREIFNSPRDQHADKNVIITDFFDKIESKKIGDNVWALNRSSAEPAIHNAGAALLAAIKRVEPGYRLGEGPSLKFNTDLGTAIINKEGFLVQNIAGAKLTENFGIKQGDVIKSINGYPVNSLLGIYRAYENIASNKDARLLSINISRDGKAKALVYKIR